MFDWSKKSSKEARMSSRRGQVHEEADARRRDREDRDEAAARLRG